MSRSHTVRALCITAAAALLPLLAHAAPVDRAAAKAWLDHDTQGCQETTEASTKQRAECLRDARSAYQTRLTRQAGTLDDGSTPADWARNALLRCEAHRDPDSLQGCERMVQGEGVRTGSVANGAVLVVLTMQVEEPVQTAAAPTPAPGR